MFQTFEEFLKFDCYEAYFERKISQNLLFPSNKKLISIFLIFQIVKVLGKSIIQMISIVNSAYF